jgi:hypothetical protein
MSAGPIAIPAYRLNSPRGQEVREFLDYLLVAPDESRCKTAPDRPAGSLKYPLTHHVVRPSVRPVIPIAITLDGNTLVVFAFHDQVDPEVPYPDLRVDPEAPLTEQVEHFPLEIRFTPVAPVLQVRRLSRIGTAEMPKK